MAERARAELAAALEPRDDAVGGEHLRHRVGQVAGALVDDPGVLEPAGQLVVAPAPAERRGPHRRRPGRRARGRRAAPRRARCPLSPDAGCTQTSSNGPDACRRDVGHAVERDAARHRERGLAGALVQPRRELERRPPPGAAAPSTRGRRGGSSSRRRPRASRGARRSQSTGSVAKPPSPRAWTSVASSSRKARLPVRRHRHDLVLVRRAAEAEVVGELLVQQPERVRELLARRAPRASRPRGAPGEVRRALAATVDDEHRAGRVRRGARPQTRRARRGGRRSAHGRVQARQRGREEARGPLARTACAAPPTRRR